MLKVTIETISKNDFVLVLVCPYHKSPPIKENLKIRKMENRIFIEELSSDSLRKILEDDLEGLESIIRESMKIYVKEAFEKGFTLPLTGFKEKIQNKPTLLRDKFVDEVGRAWSIELKVSEPTKSEILYSSAVDGDGKLINLARNSLKEFIKLDEDDIIRGCKFSRYEERFLELFDIEKEGVSKHEIESSMRRYFSSYSRFSIPDFIGRILEKKNILEIHGDFYKIKKPGDYLQRIVDILNQSLITLVSRNDIITQEKISSLKIIVDELKEKPSSEITWTDIATYNTKLDSIEGFLEGITEQIDIQDIKENLNLLKEYLEKKFSDLNISISDIEYSEPPEDPFIEKYFAETGKSRIDFDSLVAFINEEIKEPISFNPKIINDIKSIMTSIQEIDSSYESIVAPLFKKVENLKMDLGAPRIEKLMDYEYGHSYSSDQIKRAKEILQSFNQFLKPYFQSIETLNELYPELRELFDYIESHSDYMEDLKIDSEKEEVRIKRLAKNEFNLCEPYLRHILKEYEDLKERIDSRIKYKELHRFFEGLELKENVTEDKLKVKIKEEKEGFDEFKHLSADEITQRFLKAGFIKKITIKTEYYNKGDQHIEEMVKYERI